MPALEYTDLRQRAVLWTFKDQDRFGVQVLNPPIEVAARWLLNDSQVIDPAGNTIASSGNVILAIGVVNMSLMWLGKLVDLPSPPNDLHQLIKANTTPDLKNRQTRFEYYLMRFSDQLPTVSS